MGLKAIGARMFAWSENTKIQRWASNPISSQQSTFYGLIAKLSQTAFGIEHGIQEGISYDQWKSQVPIRDYEALAPWVERIKSGEEDVLWPGKPFYFCKTSGTTSGTKFIPMSQEGIDAQIRAARHTLLTYIAESGNAKFSEGKMIFLQGSPTLSEQSGIATGRLSGIVAHHVPSYLTKNRKPSYAVNTIEDWEEKVEAIVEETKGEDMRLISGIPPWVQMYFERLLQKTGKNTIKEIFPNFSVFVHGGVNYRPYKKTMDRLVGGEVDCIETYPASEGFIAFQDSQHAPGMLLNLDAGIFYEFIPMENFHDEQLTRVSLEDVELDVNYAIVLNTSSGLWGYLIGDTIKFVSLEPYRIVVTGRTKHFISAFGEHVIAEEVEQAMEVVCATLGVEISEFHVAPQVNPSEGLPFHEWIVESDQELPEALAPTLDETMRKLNTYYNDLIDGNVLRSLVVNRVSVGTFNNYMNSIGKLGGQNKLPRLSNRRNIADKILP